MVKCKNVFIAHWYSLLCIVCCVRRTHECVQEEGKRSCFASQILAQGTQCIIIQYRAVMLHL
jgi:hypothetical protein